MTGIVIALLFAGVAGFLQLRPSEGASAASEWVTTDFARVRLVSATLGVGQQTHLKLGIQIKLEPEWKTYWRHPGEAGIPPRFNWDGSENLNGVEVSWPAPSRYASYGLETIGYKDEIVLPVTATLARPGAVLNVGLALDYAVCRDICVPLSANLSLRVPEGVSSDTPFADLIRRFSVRVPEKMAGDPQGPAPRLNKLAVETDGKDLKIRGVVSGFENVGEPDVFVEAGEDFGFGPPEIITGQEPGIVEFVIPVHRYRKNLVLAGRSAGVTVVAGGKAYEWQRALTSD
ncbi:MAG: hypothetical protein HQ511_04105 [Rhodospirillales bacterium]|nr:hypothetical protein [Rhodospirillales bacterium]